MHHPIFERLNYVPHCLDESLTSSSSLCNLSIALSEARQEPIDLDSAQGILEHHLSGAHEKAEWITQFSKFHKKAIHIHEELGSWAADYFICQTIRLLKDKSAFQKEISLGLTDEITEPLLRILDKYGPGFALHELSVESHLSSKVKQLINFLEEQNPKEHSGLIFVRQRAVVSVLFKILSTHPRTTDLFQCATFVGLSNSSKRKHTIAELLDLKAQEDTMAEFRAGRKNLIIATDVLEEGIDVTACNLVICFDPPPTLKSFIQRRGRARKEKSKFAIMLPLNDVGAKLAYWQELEKTLIKTYQDEERLRLDAASAEAEEEEMDYRLHVELTG